MSLLLHIFTCFIGILFFSSFLETHVFQKCCFWLSLPSNIFITRHCSYIYSLVFNGILSFFYFFFFEKHRMLVRNIMRNKPKLLPIKKGNFSSMLVELVNAFLTTESYLRPTATTVLTCAFLKYCFSSTIKYLY